MEEMFRRNPEALRSVLATLAPEPPEPLKSTRAYQMLRKNPTKWFGDAPIEDRDRALLNAEPVWFVTYSNQNYMDQNFLKHIVSLSFEVVRHVVPVLIIGPRITGRLKTPLTPRCVHRNSKLP